ncbi:alanine racemase [Maribacter algicola]|uniref:Alanine racemase n=1 Tax=Maribacter algicola TaxID=2498892 RepID=A0A3R8R9U6_9FLAO|nr:alanine racemase [Maribacter algicola]RRQ50137.1 alanine racemase [Maribacter algicola]
MPKAQETVLEIDLKSLEHNYRFLRTKLNPSTKFLSVVKAFAYGSDADQIALKLQELGTDYFAVAYVKEGVALRKAGITKPILVLHPQAVNFERLIEFQLEPSLYAFGILNQFMALLIQKKINRYPVHIKFNTGLNRLGFGEKDLESLFQLLQNQDNLEIVSLFSHLAATEDPQEEVFTKNQIALFEKISVEVANRLKIQPIRHILNTSGILNYSEAQYDMVRSGIGLYGYGNEAKFDAELKPIATLKTIISQIHHLSPNDTVGYNRAYVSKSPRVSATLPIGHADGIGRQYGKGKTFVLVNGQMAPIIGNVCMDMIMIDITDIPSKEGDEVVIFGPQLSAHDVAKTANTISYELITGISQRVKRIYTP